MDKDDKMLRYTMNGDRKGLLDKTKKFNNIRHNIFIEQFSDSVSTSYNNRPRYINRNFNKERSNMRRMAQQHDQEY
jgi:hypothetical protein